MEEFNSKNTGGIIFPEREERTKSAEELFSERLKREIMYKQVSDLCAIEPEWQEPLNERIIYDDIAEFIREHIKSVGKEQAIKDFQTGLNLLTGYKKETVLDEQVRLEEDADFGEKTFAMLHSALGYYPLEVIKKYIKLGAANNGIWETKQDESFDTDEYVKEVNNKLSERGN